MENRSLISIIQETTQLEVMLLESGGEITPEIEQALATKEVALPEKVDGYSHVLKRLEALEGHYKSQSDYFRTISSQCKKAQDRLKENMIYAMHEMGLDEVKGNDMRFKLIPTSGSLIIENQEMVPLEFKSEVVETKIDNKLLKQALQKGDVPGAKLEPGFSLRQFANTGDKKKKAASNE